jgi:hypothetical protein
VQTENKNNSAIKQFEMSNTKSSYFLPELSSPAKFTFTPLSKYQVKQNTTITQYHSPHISHAIQGPVIHKSKHVDYYKHMKEKYEQKRKLVETLLN